MKKKIFISYSDKDKELVQIITETIKRICLNNVITWYAGNPNYNEGLRGGANVYDTILNNIKDSNLCLVILTENCIGNQWIHFECGYAIALGIKLKSLYIDVGIDEIGEPLKRIQGRMFNNVQTAQIFFNDLLAEFGYNDILPNTGRSEIEKCINEINKIRQNRQNERQEAPTATDIKDEFENLKIFINKQFIDMASWNINDTTSVLQEPYTIKVKNNFTKDGLTHNVIVDPEDTVQDVLNKIYFLLEGKVKAYTYLNSWILRHRKTKANLVIYEIATSIPAKQIFTPNDTWDIEQLSKPYTSQNSKYDDGTGLNAKTYRM